MYTTYNRCTVDSDIIPVLAVKQLSPYVSSMYKITLGENKLDF